MCVCLLVFRMGGVDVITFQTIFVQRKNYFFLHGVLEINLQVTQRLHCHENDLLPGLIR